MLSINIEVLEILVGRRVYEVPNKLFKGNKFTDSQ